ncbi:MAG: hypothetical protein QM662_18385, partial [Gordonia sp. (in: high G+C Gram-positive bacteria)]
LRVYGHLARRTGDRLALRVTEEIVDFLRRDLLVDGGFASALDADTGGVEGATYVWTPAQLAHELGDEDGAWAAAVFTVTETGTFEHGASTLQLLADPADAARHADVRRRLLAARDRRPQPARDEKVVTAWNALAITGLVESGVGLGHPEWIELAGGVAGKLVDRHIVDGKLRRSSLGGVVGEPRAALDDHAALVVALLTLHTADGESRWLHSGLDLLDTTISTFADPGAPGSWFDAAGTGLIARPRDPVDGATPAGASMLAEALLLASTVAVPDRATRYAELADATLARGAILLAKVARSAGHWLTVAQARVAGPLQIAVSETAGTTGELADTARRLAPGGTVVVAGAPGSATLLDGREPVDGADAAYVCRGTVCDLPVTSSDALRAALTPQAH